MNVEGSRAENAIGQTRLPLMHGFFSIGNIAGAVLGALASTPEVPVALHFSVIAVLIMVVGSRAVARLPRSDTPESSVQIANHTGGQGGKWFDRRLLFVGFILAGTAFAEGAGKRLDISLAAVDGHDFTNTAGAYVYGCFVAAVTVGRLAGGRLVDKYGSATVLATLAVVGIAGVILTTRGTGATAVVAGALLWGIGISLGFPACISAAADHPTNAARRVSFVSICGYATFLVGPPAIGFIGEHAGILDAFWLVAGTLAMALLCAPAIRRNRS